MLLTCKEASKLVSQGLDRSLGRWERLRVHAHLLICSGCRNFSRHLRVIRTAIHRRPGLRELDK